MRNEGGAICCAICSVGGGVMMGLGGAYHSYSIMAVAAIVIVVAGVGFGACWRRG